MQQIIDRLETIQQIYENLNSVDIIFFDNSVCDSMKEIIKHINLIECKISNLRLDSEKCKTTLENLKKNKLVETHLFLYYFLLKNVVE